MKTLASLLLLVVPALCSCASSGIGSATSSVDHPLERVALSPDGGELVDAIAATLSSSGGYSGKVLSREETRSLLRSLEISSITVGQPENLAKLAASGIDAWLYVEADVNALSDKPKSVLLRVLSTRKPDQYIQLDWKNGWGGMPGSLADAAMKKDAAEAGAEIGAEVAGLLAATYEPARGTE
jgi:hypothetical protein